MPNNSDKILHFLASIGQSEVKTLTVLLTHPDIDHAGSLAELKEKIPNIRIGIHELDAATLCGEKGPKQVKGLTGSMFKVLGGLMKLRPVKADLLLKDGQEVEGLTVIHTPGHTVGSACFYDAKARAIFVGDALRTDNNGNLQRPAYNADDDQALMSLDRIAPLSFERIYPGHGAPITDGGSEKLASFIKGLRSQ
jgi:glyoxylase-like metal-dependent hydrolase (beta-lactamase superfamily II)